MISLVLARRLRDAGLRWDPSAGDRFVVADREMDEQVFTLADMSVDVHEFTGGRVLGFNGTLEWALDSVQERDCVWLPAEADLRARLAGTFRSLRRADDGWQVELNVNGRMAMFRHGDAAEAYGQALLHLITGDPVPTG